MVRQSVKDSKLWVIKFGSAILTTPDLQLNVPLIKAMVRQIAQIVSNGKQVVIVSSGAVASGMSLLGWKQRPMDVHNLQAAASVGQAGLVQTYENAFKNYQLHTGQLLLTQSDIESRERYLNIRTTIQTLLNHNIIPVINENDSVATEEICFGDNDSLASYVANIIEAHSMLLLTDQNGFYNKDPSKHVDAVLLDNLSIEDKTLDAMTFGSGALGRGGMQCKLNAARIAARSNTQTIIANGYDEKIIHAVTRGQVVGSWFKVVSSQVGARVGARKRWLGAKLKAKGSITLDNGAKQAILKGGNSLLPIGVIAVSGNFERGDLVKCLDENGTAIAQGLCNYNSNDCTSLLRCHSENIQKILGYCHAEEVIHCDNLLLL